MRDRFHSWRKPIYSVPTRRGLIPLALTAFAGFEAFFRGSVHHQWIVVLMSVFTVMHLIDASADLRSLELAPDPDSSVFAGTPTKVNLFQSGRVSFPSLHLVAEFAKPGIHLLPAKKVEHRSEAGLFHFWRTFRFQRPVWVLPAPVNHGAPFGDPSRNQPEDPDQLAPIRDPRLL
ncbi:MAG: hypothetical protein EBX52_05125, partial [Proteobacteria bacterium]|nr:hypothetical protein [Pseudomonadota bacterium]